MPILIVDDEADIRDSLREWLEDEGYTVVTAADGTQALARLDAATTPPCIVILDLIMPDMSGNEIYRRMQSDPRLSGIPVVISTSDPSRAPAGVLIMRKPVNLVHLLGAIRQHCADPACC